MGRIPANGNGRTISVAFLVHHVPTGSGLDRLADFVWCKMAAQRGWCIEETAHKLLDVSEKAQEQDRCGDKGYALVTAQNAAAAAAKGRQRDRG